MKNFFRGKAKKIKNLCGFLLFAILLIQVFCSVTYLFRGNQYGGYGDRINFVGIKEEKKDSLDVIYIGGSAAFVYWEPFRAYSDYGFTSYNLATNTIQAESLLAYMKYARKYQDPDVFIVGVRAFEYYQEEGNEIGLRVASDAMDIDLNRAELIAEYLENRTLDTDKAALYWDIAKYHTNTTALSNQTAWRLTDNSEMNPDKGYQMWTTWCYLQEPQNFQTDQRTELSVGAEKVLRELLDYCYENELNVVFVVSPYYISQESYSVYNTIGDIVSTYGYSLLNANDYYEDMDIDFGRDFYNVNHVNVSGSEKYTAFLGKYLAEHYNLPDHRDDAEYSEWGEAATTFLEQTIVRGQSELNSRIASADEAVAIGSFIREETDWAEWSNMINDARYTVVTVGNATVFGGASYSDKKIFNRLGFGDIYGQENLIHIASEAKVIGTNSDGGGNCSVKIGWTAQVQCVVENGNKECSIVIDGDECSRRDANGLNMVVFDNNYRTIIDSVTLICADSGKVEMVR